MVHQLGEGAGLRSEEPFNLVGEPLLQLVHLLGEQLLELGGRIAGAARAPGLHLDNLLLVQRFARLQVALLLLQAQAQHMLQPLQGVGHS